jgi:transcriptional regulator with XRE-family HTH domain
VKNEDLGEFLKHSREKAGLAQADVAKKIRLATPQCVSNWETGRASPPMKYLVKLCELYDIELNELFDHLVDYSLSQTRKKMQQDFEKITKSKKKSSA